LIETEIVTVTVCSIWEGEGDERQVWDCRRLRVGAGEEIVESVVRGSPSLCIRQIPTELP